MLAIAAATHPAQRPQDRKLRMHNAIPGAGQSGL